jgi:catechol 2,3-dioxygenase-like lactoylglutathione lyase family enzyme
VEVLEAEVVRSCIPIIPSADLARSLRFWVEGLGFHVESEMREENRLIFCMLRRGHLAFMLNRRGGASNKPEGFEGIRLYWAPVNFVETRERLVNLGFTVSEIVARDYGQTEFFVTDDDGYTHCFGVPTP